MDKIKISLYQSKDDNKDPNGSDHENTIFFSLKKINKQGNFQNTSDIKTTVKDTKNPHVFVYQRMPRPHPNVSASTSLAPPTH